MSFRTAMIIILALVLMIGCSNQKQEEYTEAYSAIESCWEDTTSKCVEDFLSAYDDIELGALLCEDIDPEYKVQPFREMDIYDSYPLRRLCFISLVEKLEENEELKYCKHFEDDDIKALCITGVASNTGKEQVCKDITIEVRAHDFYPFGTDELITSAQKCVDAAKLFSAREDKDVQACLEISELGLRNSCVRDISVITEDFDSCGLVTKGFLQENCKFSIITKQAVVQLDKEKCLTLDSKKNKIDCLIAYAINHNDEDACELTIGIDEFGTATRDSCLEELSA